MHFCHTTFYTPWRRLKLAVLIGRPNIASLFQIFQRNWRVEDEAGGRDAPRVPTRTCWHVWKFSSSQIFLSTRYIRLETNLKCCTGTTSKIIAVITLLISLSTCVRLNFDLLNLEAKIEVENRGVRHQLSQIAGLYTPVPNTGDSSASCWDRT